MTRNRPLLIVWLAGLGLGLDGSPARAGEAIEPSRDVVVLHRCEVEYRRSSLIGVANMGPTSSSILQDCLVRRGDRVQAGQVLGRVMDRDIRAELDLRAAQSANDTEVRLNEAKYAQALNRLKRSEALQKRVFVSVEELGGTELEVTTAKLQIEQSKHLRDLAAIQLRQAEVMARAREYISPHDGVVVEIVKEQGEAIAVTEPNFRVVDVDWVKVTGYLNLSDYWRVREGQEVRITPELDGVDLPVEREVFPGRVVFVDRRIDPVNRTCKVVAEVANRDLLLASGLEARMEIELGAAADPTQQQAADPRRLEAGPAAPKPGPIAPQAAPNDVVPRPRKPAP
jgi:RND family efflux transporter MFP subunit